MNPHTLEGRSILVVGGSRGLGLGTVEALAARKAKVTVIARTAGPLAELKQRLGVATVAHDANDPVFARGLLADLRPDVVIVNAGDPPPMGPLHELSWEDFSHTWQTDVKLSFHWAQAALRLPLAPGTRMLLTSSGAAVKGSPLSGGYGGGKRAVWLMASYANAASERLGLGVRFQALIPRQMVGGTTVGDSGARGYARWRGITPEQVLQGFSTPMTPRQYGEHVATVLSDPTLAAHVAFNLSGETGLTPHVD